MKFLDGQTVGIDLGTTYSSIARLNADGKPTSLLNADGRNITPSVVLLGDDGRVQRADIVTSSGNSDVDKLIQTTLAEMPALRDLPPPSLRQVQLRLNRRA